MLYVVVSIPRIIMKRQIYQLLFSVRRKSKKKEKKLLKRHDANFAQDFFPLSLRFVTGIS